MGKQFVKRFLPDREKIVEIRMLRWLGPTLLNPEVWHISRRSIAVGLAIGLFFGLLIPVAQIPFAAVAAIFLRANLAIAAASTLVTNPFTFAPIYFVGYQLGDFILGDADLRLADTSLEQAQLIASGATQWLGAITGAGAPLFLGLFILAVTSSALAYVGVNLAWRAGVVLRMRKRRQRLGR
jgi:uncharacterized protein (DUF2062 family)